jgi:hypothetical protein
MEPRLKRALLFGVMLVLLGAGCGGSGKLGAKALSQQAMLLQSEAAEGALLAEDAVSDKTTHVFIREHAADLYKAASRAEASLKAAKSKRALEPKLRRLAVLAAQVRADLERLGHASKPEARTLGRELQAAADESRKIGEGLR